MSRTRRCEPVPEEVRQTAHLLERRWQLSIVYAALTGALRFNEFADAVSGISPRMLSERRRGPDAAPLSPPRGRVRGGGRGGAAGAHHPRNAPLCPRACRLSELRLTI